MRDAPPKWAISYKITYIFTAILRAYMRKLKKRGVFPLQTLLEKVNAFCSPIALANIAMIITVLAWGTSFISTKIAVAEIPPITLAFIRFFITSILLYAIIRKVEPKTKMTGRDRGKVALAGVIGISLYFCLENTAIQLTTASNASLITSVTPILSIALNLFFFRARLSLLQIVGIVIGIGGAYLTVTANGRIDFSSATFQGNLFMLGAMTAWAFYTVLSKHLQSQYSGIFLVAWQTIFATTLLAPLSLLEYGHWQSFSFHALGQIVYLAVICSGLGYFLYVYALKTLDVVVTTLYLNLVPVVGVASGYVILGETVLPIQIIGGAIIICAICIANFDRTLPLFQKRRS